MSHHRQWMTPFNFSEVPAFVGRGRADDPFVPKDASAFSSETIVLAVLRAIRLMEQNHGSSHRILGWNGPSDDHLGVHKVIFQRRRFTQQEVVTDRVAFYFSLPDFAGVDVPLHSPLVWSLKPIVAFPLDLGWLHFDTVARNSDADKPLDVSLFYSGLEGKAAIYVYGSGGENREQDQEGEAERAFAVALDQTPGATTPWPFGYQGPLYGRHFLTGEQMSYLGIGSIGGKLVKVRLTFGDLDQQHREMNSACLTAILRAIEGRPTF